MVNGQVALTAFMGLFLVAVGMSLFSFAGGTISQNLTVSATDSSIALRGLSIAAAGLVGAVLAPILRSQLQSQPSI